MKVIWLGQAGLLIEANGHTLLVDPYLSDSVEKVNPKNFRRVAIDYDFYKIRPDMIILTHDHLDHTDPETLGRYLSDFSDITVLASYNAWMSVREFGGSHNYVSFNRHTVWTQYGITFRAVRAEHSDEFAIGVIIDDGENRIYIVGDSLYNEEIFKDIPETIDTVFVPINGEGNNMNMTDAAEFAKRINATYTVPVHFGMFDELNPMEFPCENKVIPEFYKEVEI